jgi:hypothetical protein
VAAAGAAAVTGDKRRPSLFFVSLDFFSMASEYRNSDMNIGFY